MLRNVTYVDYNGLSVPILQHANLNSCISTSETLVLLNFFLVLNMFVVLFSTIDFVNFFLSFKIALSFFANNFLETKISLDSVHVFEKTTVV